MTKEIPSYDDLIELYSKEGSTISSLARYYNTSNPTVRSWLKKYNIERKSHKQACLEANNRYRKEVKPSKEVLEKLYENSFSVKELEHHFNVSQQTIYGWLEEYEIEQRSHSESCKNIKQKQFEYKQFSKDYLDAQYDRSKSINDLAEKLSVSRSHIRNQLKKNDIKIESIEPSYRSKAEIDLCEFLISEFPTDNWAYNTKQIISPYELDMVNLDKNIAIEYCGLYWHSENSSGKTSLYHRNKYLMCKEKGITLITVFESDNIDKVKKLLLKLLGKTTKIGARKTEVVKLKSSDAMKFHNEHHLHGSVGGSHHYALTYNNEIVLVASYGKNRFSNKYQYECSRITTHGSYTIVGGVSKLMKHFIVNEKPDSIITFSDLRFGEGNVYNNCKFTRLEDTPPNYWYSKKYTAPLYSRVKFQKHKLKESLESFSPLKTEYENMLDNGWDRIWDCGNSKYVLEIKKGGE